MMRDRVLDEVCPGRIVRSASPKGREFSPSIVNLLPSSNVANLEKIECNVLEPVLLRLLVCKEENPAGSSDDCPYPGHKNFAAVKFVCSDSNDKLAQMYIRHEKPNTKSRSCVILFVEGQYLNKTDEILERMKKTVEWLDIERERPYFYILHYGDPQFLVTANNSRRRIDEGIKNLFNGYSQDEDVCSAIPVPRKSKSLIVNHTKKFIFRAS
jgi:hypothetical protein